MRSAQEWWKKFRQILGLNTSKKSKMKKEWSQLGFRRQETETAVRKGWKELDRLEDREVGQKDSGILVKVSSLCIACCAIPPL